MLNYDQFSLAAKELAALNLDWYGGQSRWTWISPTQPLVEHALCNGYLSLTITRALHPLTSSSNEQTSAPLPACNTSDIHDDDDISVAVASTPALSRWIFHVCYSQSYREPVLYFESHDQSGSPLPMSTVLENMSLDGHRGNRGDDGMFPAVTQEDHPVLGRPLYMLHPCQTSATMCVLHSDISTEMDKEEKAEEVGVPAIKYLVTWLSVAGQPCGIAPSVEDWEQLLIRLAPS